MCPKVCAQHRYVCALLVYSVIVNHIHSFTHITLMAEAANPSSGAIYHFLSKALMMILSSLTHTHSHTDGTAIGSNVGLTIIQGHVNKE